MIKKKINNEIKELHEQTLDSVPLTIYTEQKISHVLDTNTIDKESTKPLYPELKKLQILKG